MNSLTVSASPHITNKSNSTRSIMTDVLIALLPSVIASVVFFGYHVVINILVCAVGCFCGELLYGLITGKKWNKEGVKKSTVWDLSCLVTAVILALNLPSVFTVKGWGLNIVSDGKIILSFDTIICCLLASVFAIMMVKMLFGGIGKNFANPALTGRVFLFLAVGLSAVQTVGSGLSATTGATWLEARFFVDKGMLFNMFIGNVGSAAVGETCVIAILLGYIYLSLRKVIDLRIPLMIVAFTFVFALIFDGLIKQHLQGSQLFMNALAHVLSGGLLFGAVFMATDYSTSPDTLLGNVVYCLGIALFTVLIRVFAAAPEGMSFAILIMNIATPLIDKYIVPKPFGYEKAKKEKDKKSSAEAAK